MAGKKLAIGIFSLTGCEGCLVALLDLTEKLLALNEKVDMKNFRLFEEMEHLAGEKFDVSFVEGSALTAAQVAAVKEIRKNTGTLVALGSCAHIGGIYHLKQYQDKKKIYDYIYQGAEGIDNLPATPLAEIVKVDYFIPGCPITAEEFYRCVYGFLIGKLPAIKQNPVCYECQVNDFECALQKGEVCFGPITQGGCGAVCLKSKQGCWGCRGLVEDAEVGNLVNRLRENHFDKEIVKVLEVFGAKELVGEWERKDKGDL